MQKNRGISRRAALAAGAGIAASWTDADVYASPKQPGETRVLFLMGDYWHNPVTQELNWRRVLEPTGWRLLFAQSSRFLTPDAMALADLVVLSRYAGPDSIGWVPDRLADNRPSGAPFMTDEQERAIVDNVRNRGMGHLAVHCSIWNRDRADYLELIGVTEPYMHTPVQPATLHKLNGSHPVTRGLEPCEIVDDEIFHADLSGDTEVLFHLEGREVPTDRAGGWCREDGRGRTVTLLPGHTPHPYHMGTYKTIMWRAAHWAIHRDPGTRTFGDGR